MSAPTKPLFTFKPETWWDITDKGKTKVATYPTLRPYRRRSWTEEALRAAFAFIKEQKPPDQIRIGGSNTREVAERCGLFPNSSDQAKGPSVQ